MDLKTETETCIIGNESDEVNESCTTRILDPSLSRYDTDQGEAVLSKKDSYFAICRNRLNSRRTRIILFIVNAIIVLMTVSGIIVLFVLNRNKGK